jgi:hypothetical protein
MIYNLPGLKQLGHTDVRAEKATGGLIVSPLISRTKISREP